MGSSSGSAAGPVVSAFHTALLRQGALIFLVLVILFAAWNGLRSWQYRRAVTRGDSGVRATGFLDAEPTGRRFLRIAFGALWVVDGLLQLQPNMPLGMPGNVLQPSAAASPDWVRTLVGFASGTWSRHPAEAAAATVWIQLGIGLLLLVAPRGRWSRWAGAASAGWGLVVWVFGEAFGGLFSPGLTVLFGAPGAVFLYVVAGGLIALPDRAWSGRKLGEVVTGCAGLFLLTMAVLQAWPGRGFWQGRVGDQPGTLAGMVRGMADTPQPHVLSTMVSWFASVDESHGWIVNLAAVILVAAVGLALVIGGRLVRPAVIAFAGFAVFDWIFIEDFGVWGGTGTDPNSMVPMLCIVIGGYLALATARAPAAVPVGAEATAVADADRASGEHGWLERLNPGYAGRLAAAVGAVAIVLVGTAPMVAASVNPRADTLLAESVNGPPDVADGPAPNFHLVDQRGRPVSLSDLRGYTVVLTFLDPVCTTDCPLIAQELRITNDMLGAASSKVRFVAVAANPSYNSVDSLAAFDRQEGLDGQANWLFLTGPVPTLRAVWNDYGEGVLDAPAGGMAAHSDIAFVIDSSGITRRVMDADPGDGAADHASFSSLLAEEITQVMHS